MEALEDLLSDTDCEGHIDRSGHFSFLALGKCLADKAPPRPLLAPFDEAEEGGVPTAEDFQEQGAREFPAGAAWGAAWPDFTRDGSTAAGSACSGDNDSDVGSCQRCPGRSLWDLSVLGVAGAEEDSQDGSAGPLEEEEGGEEAEEEEAEAMPALPCMSRIQHASWELDETGGAAAGIRCEAGTLPSSSSTPRSSCTDGPTEAVNLLASNTARHEDPADLDNMPISASGSYRMQASASPPARTKTSGARPPAPLPAPAEAAARAVPQKPRPFLKKGTRMPRSDLPQSSSTPVLTKPIVNPSPKKPLRLRPRASSQGAQGVQGAQGNHEVQQAQGTQGTAPSCPTGPSQVEEVLGPPLQQRGSSWSLAELPQALEVRGLKAEALNPHRQPPFHVPPSLLFSDSQVPEEEGGDAAVRGHSMGSGGGSRPGTRKVAGARGESVAEEKDVWGPPLRFPGSGTTQQAPGPGRPTSASQASGPQSHSLEIEEDWGDSLAWEMRGADNLRCLGAEEAPTSSVVRSYFQTSNASGTQRVPPQKGAQPVGAVTHPLTPSAQASKPEPDGFGFGRDQEDAGDAGLPEADDLTRPLSVGHERVKAQALEQEREELRRMQARAAQAERDVARERQKLLQEVEAERQALHMEFDAERAALKKERRRLGQGAERQRQQLAEDREMMEERRRLQDRTEQLEEEIRQKERRWQRTVDRLQRQVTDLTRKNQELQDEVRRSNQEAHRAQQRSSGVGEAPRRSMSAVATRGRRASTPKAVTLSGTGPTTSGSRSGTPTSMRTALGNGASTLRTTKSPRVLPDVEVDSQTLTCGHEHEDAETAETGHFMSISGVKVEEDVSLVRPVFRDVPAARHAPDAVLPGPLRSGVCGEGYVGRLPSQVCEVRSLEGKTERTFDDGHREVEFANGLRKVMWPDGRSSVMFQNGDQKEIHPDGTIVYHYSATGAVQTTLPDGSDLFRFRDGQFEQHNPDGSKEIRFANGTTKRVFIDGSEEICFTDGTVRRSSCTNRSVGEDPPPASSVHF